MPPGADRGSEIVQQVFGGALYQQGRGFYSGLELFAILRGEVLLASLEGSGTSAVERVLPLEGPARYLRPSHDHARRLLVSDEDVISGVFGTKETRDAVRGLLRGLEAPVPGRRRSPDKWQLRHLFPYPAEAIHYDAVDRRKKVSVERYQFRGAGGFAHRVLRTDRDLTRLADTRARFRVLLKDSGSSVGQLLHALARHDEVKPPTTIGALSTHSPFEDEVESKSLGGVDDEGSRNRERFETRWTELLREGVHRILMRDELTDFDRVESLLHWVPFCIAMHQLAMARRTLGTPEDGTCVFDAGHRRGPIRSTARSHFGQATMGIKNSLLFTAKSIDPNLRPSGTAWWKGPRTFFTTTLFAVGASNANVGMRHFELRPQLIQTIVRALVDVPISHDVFARQILGEKLRIVCDTAGAEVLKDAKIDRRDLKSNGQALVARIDEVGMLRALSDATLMVGIHE